MDTLYNKELYKKSKDEYYKYQLEQYKKGLLDNPSINELIDAGYVSIPKKSQGGISLEIQRLKNEKLDEFEKEKDRYRHLMPHNIKSKQWKPSSIVYHDIEFYAFINSFLESSFLNKISYHPFDLYKAQAIQWYDENVSPNEILDDELRYEIIREEFKRCDENTLYFAMKYGYVKEGNTFEGSIRYKPKEHNALIFFLLDCGYSIMLGKPRQIFSSTTMGLFALKKLLFQNNFYMKFITEDEKTGLEIFEDKLKYPFRELPSFMQPGVISDRDFKFWLGRKPNKGDIEPPNSRVEVVAPSKTAINGGSPQLVLIDEIGNIPILSEMIFEALPTMFVDSNSNGRLEMKRQLISWGCVCAGTKVWNNKGELVNIENLKQEDGILGYDKDKGTISKEEITYWQPPFEKRCYRITLVGGTILECSEDHPILTANEKYKFYRKNGKRYFEKKVNFVETKDLKIGRQVAMVDNISTFKGVVFRKIKNIEYIGIKPVYNLTAGTTNTYIANGIITHNTGVSDVKGKGAYEREWNRIMTLWMQKNPNVGFVPVFLSWHTRCDAEHYKNQKEIYYGGKYSEQNGVDLETTRKMFHQHYPSSYMDMFTLTSKTLVSNELISNGFTNIRTHFAENPNNAVVYGYFEPIFDYSKPYTESFDVPYFIRDAKFVPCEEEEINSRATAIMYCPPDRDYKNRYYQGTDPIAVETGHSKFASVIWDKLTKTPVCIVNVRKQHDNNYCFLQSMLMGIYYDTNYEAGVKRGTPELVEANIGTNYTDYKANRGYDKKLVYNGELPENLKGGSRLIGIDNKSTRALYIIDKMRECVKTYYKNIYFDEVFTQLKTFVQNSKATKESWGAIDNNNYFDDLLYALTYAYVCSEYVYGHLSAQESTREHITKTTKYKKVRINGYMTRKPVLINR